MGERRLGRKTEHRRKDKSLPTGCICFQHQMVCLLLYVCRSAVFWYFGRNVDRLKLSSRTPVGVFFFRMFVH